MYATTRRCATSCLDLACIHFCLLAQRFTVWLLVVCCKRSSARPHSALLDIRQGLRTGQTAAALGLLLSGQLRQAASHSTAAQAAVTAAQGADAGQNPAEQAPWAGSTARVPAVSAAAPCGDVWPPLHTPVDPGAAELAARFTAEPASAAADPADAGRPLGAASAPSAGPADVGQPPGVAAKSKAVSGGGAAAVLYERLRSAGQKKAVTKARTCLCTAEARQAGLRVCFSWIAVVVEQLMLPFWPAAHGT